MPLPEDIAEQGRGVLVVRALVDSVRFEQEEEDSTAVSLRKRLRFIAGSPADRLTDREPSHRPGPAD